MAAPGWADALTAEFGTLGATLAGSIEARERVLRDRAAAEFLGAVHEAMRAVLRSRVSAQPILGTQSALIDYLRATQGHSGIEVARVLFLNARNCLLRDEIIASGTIDEAPFWSREIVKRCLELDAAAIILAHNHPSGDPKPSSSDIELTRRIGAICGAMGIALHDHLIVTQTAHASMRNLGLI